MVVDKQRKMEDVKLNEWINIEDPKKRSKTEIEDLFYMKPIQSHLQDEKIMEMNLICLVDIALMALESEKRKDIKVVIAGRIGKGKTSLVRRLLREEPTSLESTNGIEIHRSQCKIKSDEWTRKDNSIIEQGIKEIDPHLMNIYLKSGSKKRRNINLVIKDKTGTGKTSFLRTLFREEFTSFESTNGNEIHRRQCKIKSDEWTRKDGEQMVDLNPYCQLTDPFGMGQERNVLIQAPEKSYKSTGFDRYQERAIPFTQFGICDNPDIKKRHNKQWTIPMSYNLSRILYETIKKIGKTTEETNVFEHVHDRENETVMSDAFDHSHFLKKSRSGTLPMIIRSMSQEQSISYEKDNNKRSIYVSGSRIAVPGIFGTDERKRHRVMNPRQRKMSTEYFQNIKTINTAFLRSQGITMEHFERIIKYCNETIQCVEVHSLPQVDMSMLKMQSMEMVKIAFDLHSSQFQASYDLSSVDGNNSTFGKLNRKNKVSLDQKKTTHGNEQDNRYFSKRKLVQCQMCIDHNEALHWCNTCRRNICNFCKLYHEKVWIVKHHDVQSFQF